MIAFALLVFAAAVILIVVPRYRLTGPKILSGGIALFILRAGSLWLGRYILERTGGRLQIPAYLLVMLGWPEITMPLTLGWTANRDHALIMATGLLALTSGVFALVVYRRAR